MLAALLALVRGVLTDEPVLIQAVLVAGITAVVALVGLTLSPGVVVGIAAFVVAQIATAVGVRSKVTPTK